MCKAPSMPDVKQFQMAKSPMMNDGGRSKGRRSTILTRTSDSMPAQTSAEPFAAGGKKTLLGQ